MNRDNHPNSIVISKRNPHALPGLNGSFKLFGNMICELPAYSCRQGYINKSGQNMRTNLGLNWNRKLIHFQTFSQPLISLMNIQNPTSSKEHRMLNYFLLRFFRAVLMQLTNIEINSSFSFSRASNSEDSSIFACLSISRLTNVSLSSFSPIFNL